MKKFTHTLSVITLGVIEVISFPSTVKAHDYDSIKFAYQDRSNKDQADREALQSAQDKQLICGQWKRESSQLLDNIQQLVASPNGDTAQEGLSLYRGYINKLTNEAQGNDGVLYSELLKHATNNFNLLQDLYTQQNFNAIQSLRLLSVNFGGTVVTGQQRYSFDIWLR